MPTIQEIQAWLEGDTGRVLATAGEQVAAGADPAQVLASVAGGLASAGQTGTQFLATSGGGILQDYISSVAGGADVGDALVGCADEALTIGFTAGLSAFGVPPPASTMVAGLLSEFIAPVLQELISGPVDKTYGALGGDFAWRARKYHTQMLPAAYVAWMEGNGYSLSGAILNPPSGQSPPWHGLSLSLASWLLSGAWGNGSFILLPGRTVTGNNTCIQLGIGYTLPIDAGDGWSVFPSGWWWYPYLTSAEVDQAAAGTLPTSKRGPLWELYDGLGIDVPATIRNARAAGNAGAANIVYKPLAYDIAADVLQSSGPGRSRAAELAGVEPPATGAGVGLAAALGLILLR